MDDEMERYVNDPGFRGRRWHDVEPELRRKWSSDHPDTPWDNVAFTLRDLWERAASGLRMTSAGRSDERDEGILEH